MSISQCRICGARVLQPCHCDVESAPTPRPEAPTVCLRCEDYGHSLQECTAPSPDPEVAAGVVMDNGGAWWVQVAGPFCTSDEARAAIPVTPSPDPERALCPTCGKRRGFNSLCSSSFHCCVDCVWKAGVRVEVCYRCSELDRLRKREWNEFSTAATVTACLLHAWPMNMSGPCMTCGATPPAPGDESKESK